MSRNPVAAYTHARLPHGRRSSSRISSGKRCSTRPPTRPWATPRRTSRGNTRSRGRRSTPLPRRASSARSRRSRAGFFAGEITPVKNESVRARRATSRAASSCKRRQGARRRHPCAPLAGRGAGRHPPGLRRRADRRQFLGHRRWRGGRAGRLLRALRQDSTASPPLARIVAGATVGVPPEIMGIGPVPAIKAVLARAGLEALRYRPLRDQRGLRRAGDGLRARARPRRGQAQRQRRRHRHRPSAGRHRRAPRRHAGARAARAAAALRHRLRLHRRRPGHRAADRKPRRPPHGRTDHGHQRTRRDRDRRRLRPWRGDRGRAARAGAKVACLDVNLDGARAVADEDRRLRRPVRRHRMPSNRSGAGARRAPSTAPRAS